MGSAEDAARNARDVVPELRRHASLLRKLHAVRLGKEGRLLSEEIAADEIERLRARVACQEEEIKMLRRVVVRQARPQ